MNPDIHNDSSRLPLSKRKYSSFEDLQQQCEESDDSAEPDDLVVAERPAGYNDSIPSEPPPLVSNKRKASSLSKVSKKCQSVKRIKEESKHVFDPNTECSVCHQTFTGQIELILHFAEMHFKKKFPCKNCSLNFISNSHLNLHRQKVHLKMLIPQLEMVVDASDSVVIKEEEDEKFNDVQSDGDATPDETKKTPVKGKTKKAKVKVTVKVERSVVPTTTGVNPEDLIECIVCKLKVHPKEFASHHMVVVEEEFCCDICRQIFGAAQHCTMHIQNKHLGDSGYCNICDLYFVDLKTHRSSEHSRPACKICDKEFTTRKYLIRHMAAHKEQQRLAETRKIEGPGICDICGDQTEDMALHISEKHKTRKFAEKRAEKIPDGPGVCELCSRPFENLLLHMADKHRALGYWKCEVCDMIFDSRDKRKAHNLSTHKQGKIDRSGTCEECGKFEDNVIRHKFLAHQRFIDGPGVCLYCEVDVSNLRIHANEVHASKLPVKCPDCDKLLPGQKALKVHFAFTHTTGPVLCNVCGRVFPSSKALSQHLRYGHDKSCFDCGEVFRKSGMLIYHRYKVHGIEGDMDAITCVHCKKIFTCSDQKKRHEIKVHTTEKRRTCHVCGKVFSDAAAVKRHVKATHEHAREYVCNLCGKGHVNSARLISHGRIVHGVKFTRD